MQPTHVLTGRDQLYNLIKNQEYGIAVEELKDAYQSVLEDLQVIGLVFVLMMILSLVCYILDYMNQFDTFMAEMNSICASNIFRNQLAIVFDECLFFYELFKSLEGTRFLVLVLDRTLGSTQCINRVGFLSFSLHQVQKTLDLLHK